MLDEMARLCFSLEVAQGFRLSRLAAPRIASEARPGQFVELRVSDHGSPLLRLPLSIGAADPEQGTVDLLYEERGAKTRILAALAAGSPLACLGPLGKGFVLPEPGRRGLLVGGGIGLPPLLFLAEELRRSRCPCTVLAGARTRARHLPDALLARAAGAVVRATDDGGLGHAGPVTDLLERELEQDDEPVVYACGPHPMLAAVAGVCHRRQVGCQVSLEAYMACGYGVCVGCVVEVVTQEGASPYSRYRRVCLDGPVFDSRQVRWEA
jgi:dihydroorotate dehydrogenase electron transfer subunit